LSNGRSAHAPVKDGASEDVKHWDVWVKSYLAKRVFQYKSLPPALCDNKEAKNDVQATASHFDNEDFVQTALFIIVCEKKRMDKSSYTFEKCKLPQQKRDAEQPKLEQKS
jgi:hypothetical protein